MGAARHYIGANRLSASSGQKVKHWAEKLAVLQKVKRQDELVAGLEEVSDEVEYCRHGRSDLLEVRGWRGWGWGYLGAYGLREGADCSG